MKPKKELSESIALTIQGAFTESGDQPKSVKKAIKKSAGKLSAKLTKIFKKKDKKKKKAEKKAVSKKGDLSIPMVGTNLPVLVKLK